MKPREILISSGATQVPIDDVRCITNKSKGTTGARIAEEAALRGYRVHFVHSEGSRLPFQKQLQIDPDKPLIEEIYRLQQEGPAFLEARKNILFHKVQDFFSYKSKVEELLVRKEIEAVILAMAASDNGPEKVEGKLSSDMEEMTIKLHALPKIISMVKSQRPDVFLVGFKLLPATTSIFTLREVAYKNLLRDKQTLCVANRVTPAFNPEVTFILTMEKNIIPVMNRNALPSSLLDELENRFSKRHYRTHQTPTKSLEIEEEIKRDFLVKLQYLSNISLFPPYSGGRDSEFGYLAARTTQGTLITARGSNKSSPSEQEICLITEVDEGTRTIHVQSMEKKASLNGATAHLILEARPEVNWILHSHIQLPSSAVAPFTPHPSSQEDWESIQKIVEEGHNLVEQPHHGVLLLGKNFDDIIDLLKERSIYRVNAPQYDTAYGRFQTKNKFTDIVKEHTELDFKILDMATGTGEVSKALVGSGYIDITLADQSEAMLQVAHSKLGNKVKYILTSFEELCLPQQYDAITIRQAINYIHPSEFSGVAKSLNNSLARGGKLIFNSFVPLSTSISGRTWTGEIDGREIETVEGNHIEDNYLLHGQRTEIYDRNTQTYKVIYDLNGFFQYSCDDFIRLLKEAGFSVVEHYVEASSIYVVATK